MKAQTLRLLKRAAKTGVGWSLFFLVGLMTAPLWAQQNQIPCNRDGSTAFIPPTFGNLSETHSAGGLAFPFPSWSNTARVIDNVPTNSATISFGIGIGQYGILRVTESANTYAGGNFAGFLIKSSALLSANLLGAITIRTFNNGTLAETSTAGSLIGASSSLLSGAYEVGFITASTKPFDAIEIEFRSLAALAVQNEVFYAVQRSYCAGPTPDCNSKTSLVTSATAAAAAGYPAAINRVGATGLSTFSINNPGNITDSDLTNAATLSLGVGLGSSAFVSVKDQVNKYTNTFAGFEIANNSLAGVNLLSNITLTAYNSNTVVQSVSGSSLLAGASFLNGNRQIIGFIPNGTFDEIQISFNSVLAADVSTTSIYRAVIERFCPAATPVCRALTPLTNPTYPVYINNQRSGVDAVACVGCSITGTENVISSSATTPATIELATSVGSSARVSVANAVDTYPAGTFAGFVISSSTLASINLAGSVRITLFNDGDVVQSGTGTSLLAGATVLSGTTSQTVGTVGQVPFDEIQIEFNQLAAANPLGTISIYRALIQTACPTALACSQTIALSRGTTSAVIEGVRTGFSGGASIGGSSVLSPWNAVSADPTDYATITSLASAGTTGSISIADPASVYPPGTYAGFTIRKGSFLVSGDLFPALTLETYLDGVLQETRTGSSLLDLSLVIPLFGSSATTPYNVGFYSAKPFDEIRLRVGSLASALSNSVDVYGAFVDTRFSSNGGSLVCNFALNPDFTVTTSNVPVSGNVHTNDNVPTGTTYGTPVASAANPTTALPTMGADGGYSFTPTAPGSYTFTVPVCPAAQSTSCPSTLLLITVLDPTTTNPPVVNPDYASVAGATATPASVSVNLRANDRPGNAGGTLGTPTLTVNPAHGTATISGGNLVYTPMPGYFGDDILTYQVCETPGGRCSTAPVVIHVTPVGSSTLSVVDDYATTPANTAVSGNVLLNDQGNGLSVANASTITSAGGSLVLSSTGAYSFTPATGVTGPISFTYTACDNASPASCGTATLHLLVPALVPVAIGGTVYNDSDGGTIDGIPTNVIGGNTLYVSVVSPSTGLVVATTAVQSNGTYSLSAAPNASYSIVVSNAAQSVGSPVANTALSGAVSTAEGTSPAGDGTPDGVTSISLTASGLSGVNFGFNPLPITGSGTVSLTNNGGTSAVVIPASTFTATSPSTDTAPGSVTAIRITAFPANVSSLTVNGTTYTPGNFPTGGLLVTTDGSGAPTVGIALDPTNDGSPVSISFVAVDNLGQEATTAGLVTINSVLVPDLMPMVYARPSTVNGTSPITLVVEVNELLNVATRGPITVKVSKEALTSLSFTATATNVGGRPVQNSVWSFEASADPNYYVLTTNAVIEAGGQLSFGLSGSLTPGATKGTLTISAVIVGGSGSEIRINNNVDADKMDYFER